MNANPTYIIALPTTPQEPERITVSEIRMVQKSQYSPLHGQAGENIYNKVKKKYSTIAHREGRTRSLQMPSK